MIYFQRIRFYLFTLFMIPLANCGGGNSNPSDPPTFPPAPPPVQSPEAEWDLVWSDEFDDDIDPAKWQFEVNCWGGGNNERQCYTDRSENAFTADGILNIVAREESFSGPGRQDEDPLYDATDTSAERDYTSARLRTRDLFEFKYGRVEIRAQLPGGQGSWPALWMLPTDNVYGGWPSSGEIDILEAVNLDTDAANAVHGTLHYGLPWPQWSAFGATYPGADLDYTGEFHVYTIEWEADEIRWFVDGNHYQTQTSAGWYNYIWSGQDEGFTTPNLQAPYDQEFHLLMNLAIGGDWPGAPDTGWPEDRQFLVDYVRIYQCNSGSPDGTGCVSKIDAVSSEVAVNADAGAPEVNSFSVFDDGPAVVTVSHGEETVEVNFAPNYWQETDGNIVQSIVDDSGDRGQVWDVTFAGVGNIFLSVDDLSSAGLESALNLEGGNAWSKNGVLSFDLYVDNIDTETGLLVKMDSNYPNLGQKEIEVPAAGEWQTVYISVAEILENPLAEGSGLDLMEVRNVFVLEATGTRIARIKLDNIQLHCAINPTSKDWQSDKECGVGPVEEAAAPFHPRLDIFADAVNADIWDTGYMEHSSEGDHIVMTEVDLGDGDMVLDLQFNADGANGVSWIAASTAQDLSAFANGGFLKLDVNVLDWGTSTSPLVIKVECGEGCGTGDYPIGGQAELGVDTWNSIIIPVADLLSHPDSNLDLTQVLNGLVIFPTWDDSQGVHFQVNNARYEFDSLIVFEEETTHWSIADCCGGAEFSVLVDPIDAGRGNVVEFRFNSDQTVTSFKSSGPLDLSDWVGGSIEFDLYIEAEPENAQWTMKTECVYPCQSGDVALEDNTLATIPSVGVWQHYSFSIDDLITRGVDITSVDTPLSIFPAWGNQSGAIFRVDNVRIVKAD